MTQAEPSPDVTVEIDLDLRRAALKKAEIAFIKATAEERPTAMAEFEKALSLFAELLKRR